MPAETSTTRGQSAWLSLDAWSVILAFALVFAVRFGLLKTVPW